MDVAMLHEPQVVAWAEAPDPTLDSPAAALVRPLVAATCDFDHLLVSGRMALGYPVALGHEAVGVVTEVGDGVSRFRVGDRVVIPFQVSCGTCRRCRAGLTSACESVGWLSAFGLGRAGGDYGGLVADLVRVPYADAMLIPLPADVDPLSAASISCNIVDAYRCVAPHLTSRAGGRVLVMGGAFDNIALYAALIAQAEGADDVVLVAEQEDLRRRAEDLGVPSVERWDRSLGRFDITVDASMDLRLLAQAVEATAAGGVLTISTMYPGETAPLPLMAMFERGLTVVTGQPHVRAVADDAVALLRRGLDLAPVVNETLPWDQAPYAFTRGSGKWVISRA